MPNETSTFDAAIAALVAARVERDEANAENRRQYDAVLEVLNKRDADLRQARQDAETAYYGRNSAIGDRYNEAHKAAVSTVS